MYATSTFGAASKKFSILKIDLLLNISEAKPTSVEIIGDLENWIYTIQNEIRDEINSSKYFEWKRVEKLFTFRTRINAIRILKIFTVILFLKEYETISN